MNTLEFIVPCYNESEALPAFYEAVSKVFANLSGVAASLIFVD
ncbi:MAG TPA: glycosyltransferase, partial [Ruminococcaceae bacterium]|nr:glycosyltransferase [Oscillospiraceae bacterium]